MNTTNQFVFKRNETRLSFNISSNFHQLLFNRALRLLRPAAAYYEMTLIFLAHSHAIVCHQCTLLFTTLLFNFFYFFRFIFITSLDHEKATSLFWQQLLEHDTQARH